MSGPRGLVFMFGVVASAFTAAPMSGQKIRLPVSALQSFAARSPVAGLVRHAAVLELSSRQMTGLQEIEASTRTANRRLLEEKKIESVVPSGQRTAARVEVERSLLLALRENIRLGTVRARLILDARQRALERRLMTGAAGRRDQYEWSR